MEIRKPISEAIIQKEMKDHHVPGGLQKNNVVFLSTDYINAWKTSVRQPQHELKPIDNNLIIAGFKLREPYDIS